MKGKQLLYVVIAIVVLAVIYMVQQGERPEVSQDLGYETLVDQELSTTGIEKIEYYLSGKEDEAVVLRKQDDKWVIESHFDAPAKESTMTDLLNNLEGLEGELRSSEADVLADYGLDEESAIHMVLMDGEGNTLKHLLIGHKAPGYSENFVRLEGSNDVYLVMQNFRSPFGIYGEKNDTDPDYKRLAEMSVMKIQKDDVTRVELTAPYRELVLQLQEMPAEEPVADATPVQPPPEPETEWVMLKPEMDKSLTDSGVNKITGAFAYVNATEVVDRGSLEKYGLADPIGTCQVTDSSGNVRKILFGDKVPGGGNNRYVCFDDDDLVYKLSGYKVHSIFTGLGELVDLPEVKIAKDNVAKVEIVSGDRSFAFGKRGDAWVAEGGAADLELDSDRLQKVLDALETIEPKDKVIVEGFTTADAGLDQPEAAVHLTMKDGSQHRVVFGDQAPLTDDMRFVTVDSQPQFWLLDKTTCKDAMPEIGDLFELELFDFDTEEVTELIIRDASGQMQLVKAEPPEDSTGEAKWTLSAGQGDIDSDAVTVFLSNMESTAATDFITKPVQTGLESPHWVARVTVVPETEEGQSRPYRYALRLGQDAPGGGVYARRNQEEVAFIISTTQKTRLENLAKDIRK